MKKIYSYLFPVFLSLFALAACDEDNEEIVPMSYTDPVATVTKIEPVEGYVGNEFTINGDDFGIRTEDVKVFIGSQEACRRFYVIRRRSPEDVREGLSRFHFRAVCRS